MRKNKVARSPPRTMSRRLAAHLRKQSVKNAKKKKKKGRSMVSARKRIAIATKIEIRSVSDVKRKILLKQSPQMRRVKTRMEVTMVATKWMLSRVDRRRSRRLRKRRQETMQRRKSLHLKRVYLKVMKTCRLTRNSMKTMPMSPQVVKRPSKVHSRAKPTEANSNAQVLTGKIISPLPTQIGRSMNPSKN